MYLESGTKKIAILYTMAPIGSKINQCHFEASRLFGNIFKGIKISRQIFKAWLRGEAKNNQCHGTVALVRMAPLVMFEWGVGKVSKNDITKYKRRSLRLIAH